MSTLEGLHQLLYANLSSVAWMSKLLNTSLVLQDIDLCEVETPSIHMICLCLNNLETMLLRFAHVGTLLSHFYL